MTIRLPRQVEEDERGASLQRGLARSARPLWGRGSFRIAKVGWSSELRAALGSARSAGRVVRGLEAIEKKLATEERGLRQADAKLERPRGVRVSRLLLLADDGSERFYRNLESLLQRHGHRVLAIQIDAGAEALGASIFGPDAHARAVMLEHKDAVSQALLAMSGAVAAAPRP